MADGFETSACFSTPFSVYFNKPAIYAGVSLAGVAIVRAHSGQVSWCFMATPPPILLDSLGMADSLILMVLALVVFGPRRLPQIGRQIGKLMYEFRKASNDFKFQMEEELRLSEEADRRKKEEAERQQLALTTPTQTVEASADIGAVEPPAISEPPASDAAESPYPGEVKYPENIEPEPTRYPRISPPSTGEQVSAARPGANLESGPTAESPLDAEPSAGTAPHESSTSATEPLNQHG